MINRKRRNGLTPSQVFVLTSLIVTLGLMLSNRIRPDLAALLLAAVLGIGHFAGLAIFAPTGSRDVAIQAVTGFGQPTVITLIRLLIPTPALEKSRIYPLNPRLNFADRWPIQNQPDALLPGSTAFPALFNKKYGPRGPAFNLSPWKSPPPTG